MLLLWALLVVLLFAAVKGIYQEQLGEFDGLGRYVGVPTHSLFRDNDVLVATEAGVVASLDSAAGSIGWRVVLPGKPAIRAMVLGSQAQLYIYHEDTDTFAAFVKCIDSSSGSILWDYAFSQPSSSTTGAVELFVDDRKNQLQVLASNQLSFFSVYSGAFQWSWTPELSSNNNNNIVLHSIVVPYGDNDADSEKHFAVAVGCVASGKICNKAVVVSADHASKTCSTQLLASGEGGSSVKVLAAQSRTGSSISDFIVQASSNGVRVFHTSSSKSTNLPFSDQTPGGEVFAYLSLNGNGDVPTPLVSRCNETKCSIFQVTLSDDAPILQLLSSCTGTISTTVAFEQSVRHTSLVTGAVCVAATKVPMTPKDQCSAHTECARSGVVVSVVGSDHDVQF